MKLFLKIGLFLHLRRMRRNNTLILPKKCKVDIRVFGQGNRVEIETGAVPFRGSLCIYGDNNDVHIAPTRYRATVNLTIGCDPKRRTHRVQVDIGKDLYCGRANILLADDDFVFRVGDDCMFSEVINILGSDTHTVTDLNGVCLNRGKCIKIGHHVWLGQNVQILKNTEIPDDCIVGLGSIVSRGIFKPHSILAGTPAKIVRENITWNREFPNNYQQERIESK